MDALVPYVQSSNTKEPTALTEVDYCIQSIVVALSDLNVIESDLMGFVEQVKAFARDTLGDFRQQKFDCQAIMTTPYLKTGYFKDFMSAPAIEPSVSLPFDLRKKVKDWSSLQNTRIDACVRKAYFSRKIFFLESRFEQVFTQLGFSTEHLNAMEQLRQKFDRNLWKSIICDMDKISKTEKRTQFETGFDNFIRTEMEILSTFLAEYSKTNHQLKPLTVAKTVHAEVCAQIAASDIIKLRHQELKKIYNEWIDVGKIDLAKVDWTMVSKEMVMYLGRAVSSQQCERMYRIAVSDLVNHKPFTMEELDKLKRLTKRSNVQNWPDVVKKLGTNRSTVRVFHTYRRYIAPKNNAWMNRKGYHDLVRAIQKYKGNLGKAVYGLAESYGEINLRKILLNWKTINPLHIRGRFLPCEDALLLVGMELKKTQIVKTNFRAICDYLPWRHCNIWRCRAETLFLPKSKPWTMKQDSMLLGLVEEHGPNWDEFLYKFPDRTQKSCAARHKRLIEILKKMTLQQYHIVYSRREFKKTIALHRLHNVAKVLENILLTKSTEKQTFYKTFDRVPIVSQISPEAFLSTTALESPLLTYLTSFDKFVLLSVYRRLVMYLEQADRIKITTNSLVTRKTKAIGTSQLATERSSNANCKGPMKMAIDPRSQMITSDGLKITNMNSCQMKIENSPMLPSDGQLQAVAADPMITYREEPVSMDEQEFLLCNRRKFDRDDPASVASALHLRRISLVSQESLTALTEYENKIYTFYNVYVFGTATKASSKRNGVPSALELAVMPEIRRIIIPPKKLSRFLKKDGKSVLLREPSKELNQITVVNEPILPFDIPVNYNTLEAQKKLESRSLGKNAVRGKNQKTKIRLVREAAAKKRWEVEQKNKQSKTNSKSNQKVLRRSNGTNLAFIDFNVDHDHSYTRKCKISEKHVEFHQVNES